MSDKQERRSLKRIDNFDRTLLNNKVEHSLVTNISNEGAGLLVLKDHIFFHDEVDHPHITSGDVRLVIFLPDSSLDDGLNIDATIAWVDDDYSEDHRKMGVKFIDVNNEQDDQLNKMAEWLSKECNYFFHCELEKC
jgi:hypothetical protein